MQNQDQGQPPFYRGNEEPSYRSTRAPEPSGQSSRLKRLSLIILVIVVALLLLSTAVLAATVYHLRQDVKQRLAQQDANTTYTAGTGIRFKGTHINNIGVLSFSLPNGSGLTKEGSEQHVSLKLQDCHQGEVLQFGAGGWECAANGANNASSEAPLRISDDTNSQAVDKDTALTFVGNEGLVATVSPTDTITYGILNSGVTTIKLANGAVTRNKLADGAVTSINLADGAVTNSKLAQSSLGVTAGSGLAGGGVVTLGQSTILSLQACPAGQVLESNGSGYICAPNSNGGGSDSQTLSVAAAPGAGNAVRYDLSISGGNTVSFDDRDTLYSAATGGGLALNAEAFRLTTCPTGQVLRSTGAGTYGCSDAAVADTNTTYSAGSGLSLTGTIFGINSPTCAGTEKLRWNGTAFECAVDIDTDTNTTYSAGTGLSLSGTTFSNTGVLTAAAATTGGNSNSPIAIGGTAQNPTFGFANGSAAGQFWQWNGTAWELAQLAPGTVEQDGVVGNEVTGVTGVSSGLTRSGAGTSVSPYTLAVNVGSGLAINGSNQITNTGVLSFALGASTALQNGGTAQNPLIDLKPCADGELLRYATASSTWECAALTETSFSITDGTTTQSIANGNTITFVGNEGLVASVSATDTVTYGIASNGVTTIKIADGSIVTSKLNDGAVVTAKLADGAVTSAKILNGSVANANLANSSLTVTAGDGLTGGGAVALGASTTLNLQPCAANQILKYDGGSSSWECAADTDTNTDSQTLSMSNAPGSGNTITYDLSIANGNTVSFDDRDTLYTAATGGGLALNGQAFSLQTCPAGQLLKSTNGTTPTYTCAADTDTDTNTTYGAGTGLSLTGTTFNVNIGSGLSTDGSNNLINSGVLTVGGASAIASSGGQNPTISLNTSGNLTQTGDSLDLTNSGASAGTYGNSGVNVAQFTVDAKGRLTAVSNRALPTASASVTGVLSSSDFATFAAKENALTFNAPISRSGNTISFNLTSSGTTSTTSSASGLEIAGSGVSMLRGCASNQLLKWNSSSVVWGCASDTDTDTTYSAGTGLSLTGTTFGINTSGASTGQVLTYTGSGVAWQSSSLPSCSATSNYFCNGGNTLGAAGTLGTNDAFSLNFNTNNTQRMTIDSAGNVGINITSPTEKLHLDGKIRFVSSSETAWTGNAKFFVGDQPDSSAQGSLSGTSLTNISTYGNGSGAVNGLVMQWGGATDASGFKLSDDGMMVWGAGDENIFSVLDEDTNAYRFLINDTGNIAIGLSSPNADIQLDNGTAASSTFKFTAGTTTGTCAACGFDIGILSDGTALLNNRPAKDMGFATNGTTRMVIKSDGKIAFGNNIAGQTAPMQADFGASTASYLTFSRGGDAGSFVGIDNGGVLYLSNLLNSSLVLGTNSVARLTIDGAGNSTFSGDVFLSSTGTGTAFGLCHSGAQASGSFSNRQIVACSGTAGDMAEWYETKRGVEAGDLVMTTHESFTYDEEISDPTTGPTGRHTNHTVSILDKSNRTHPGRLLGIVSTSPHQVFGEAVKNAPSVKNPKPIALDGRVPLKVSNENGPIAAGDPLTASSTPGYAMKATEPDMIVGYALENLSGSIGKIEAFVSIGSYTPPPELSNLKKATWEGGIVSKDTTFTSSVLFNSPVRFVGNATFGGDVSITGKVKLSGDQVNEAVLPAGKRRIQIVFGGKYQKEPFVTTTPREFLRGQYRITEVTKEGFVIEVTTSQAKDIRFDWHAFTKN